MKKLEQIYEGKAKKVYATDDPDLVIVSYKDDATAFNGLKKGTIAGKGVINNKMSNMMMAMLEKKGVPSHFVEELSDRDTLVKKVQIVPLEVIIRNVAAGSFSKRYGVEEGTELAIPTIEFSYKNDELGDPLINTYASASTSSTSSWSSEGSTARSCSRTRSLPTPAASGTARPTRNWTRTVSAAISAASRTLIKRS